MQDGARGVAPTAGPATPFVGSHPRGPLPRPTCAGEVFLAKKKLQHHRAARLHPANCAFAPSTLIRRKSTPRARSAHALENSRTAGDRGNVIWQTSNGMCVAGNVMRVDSLTCRCRALKAFSRFAPNDAFAERRLHTAPWSACSVDHPLLHWEGLQSGEVRRERRCLRRGCVVRGGRHPRRQGGRHWESRVCAGAMFEKEEGDRCHPPTLAPCSVVRTAPKSRTLDTGLR